MSPARRGSEECRFTAVLVDDHELVLEGLQRALARDAIDVVAAFLDGEGALDFLAGEAAAHTRLDLVVVDLRLGDRSGIGLVEDVIRLRPEVRVAMLTSFEDRVAAVAAVEAGAKGFFLKDSACRELSTGLRRVAQGHLVIDSRLAAAVLDGGPTRRFTEHELSIVALVADGMTNRQIGEELHLSPYTVKEYLSRVMRKLGTATRAETVVRAVREGLLPERYPGQG
ncbi:MAG: response regulator transcription factor [Pseudonocardia sp.]|nr:response regulator transcription factor [Pseudonocardia sp.]